MGTHRAWLIKHQCKLANPEGLAPTPLERGSKAEGHPG